MTRTPGWREIEYDFVGFAIEATSVEMNSLVHKQQIQRVHEPGTQIRVDLSHEVIDASLGRFREAIGVDQKIDSRQPQGGEKLYRAKYKIIVGRGRRLEQARL